MVQFRGVREFLLEQEKENEFDVATGDFANLEIGSADANSRFHYFYDTRRHRLIKHFVLDEGPQVATMCDVILIKKADGYSPHRGLEEGQNQADRAAAD